MKQLGKVRKFWVSFGALFAVIGLVSLYYEDLGGFLAASIIGYPFLGLALFARAKMLNRSLKVVKWLELLQILTFLQ